jgi:outer membrane receptor for ferrienterochelin and colicins
MVRTILIGCIVFVTTLSRAQQGGGQISGKVSLGDHGAEFISVAIPGLLGTTTDSLGNFLIKNINPGIHQLQFSGLGYLPYAMKVTVMEGQTERVIVNLKEDVSNLDEVVITGTMKEVSKMESPIPIEVYTPAFFRKNPTPNIFEALAIVNGVQPQINCNVCNTGDIHINGLEGPYTMILIDGMPIVSSLSTVYGLSGIPNSMVKRIEVVKGPASTLYGSEAVGGVVNIITKDFATSPLLQADVFGTSVGEYNVDVSSRFTMKKINTLLGVNYFNYTNPTDINQDNFTDVTLQNRISLFNKWSFSRPSGKNATLAGRYVHEDRWGGEMQWTPEYQGSSVYYGESITTNRFEFIGNYQFKGKENIDFDYSYNFHHQNSYYGIAPFFARQHVGFAQLRWNHVFGKHDVLMGAPFRYIYYDDNTPGTTAANATNEPGVTILPGLFVQDEIKLNEKFTTLLGARYDHHNLHGTIFTERISLKFSPGSNNVIRLTGGSGFRVVNLFTEDHAALTGAREVVIKNDLQPEQSWNVNLNYTKTMLHQGGYVNLDGSVFFTYFTNKILGDFLTDPNKIIYDNLHGHAISKGITLNTEFYFTNGFKFIPGITLMDVYRIDHANRSEKIPQVHAPRFSGTFTMSYALKPIQLSFDLTGRVNGPMYLPVVPNDYRPDMSPWFGILNLQATKSLGKQWEIYGGVKNLLNFIPKDPLLRPFDPFDKQVGVDNPNHYTFDTSYTYAPVQGIKGFLGVRMTMK